MIGRIAFGMVCATAFVCLASQLHLYRRLKRGDEILASSKQAYEFVGHTCFALWLALGVILLPLLHISRWWIVVWSACGGWLGPVIMERLVVVSGLGLYISAGETFIQQAAEARAAEFGLSMKSAIEPGKKC